MKYYKHNIAAFTLIELIVATTIFGMIMISVMSIFILSSQMSSKIELTRVMQENIKSGLEDIAESVRKNDIAGVVNVGTPCGTFAPGLNGKKLCIENNAGGIEYYLANKDTFGDWIAVSDMANCQDIHEDRDSICRLVKKQGSIVVPLSNNLMAYESIDFFVENEKVPRVTIYATVRPAYRAGIARELVESSRMQIQTTFSERTIITK